MSTAVLNDSFTQENSLGLLDGEYDEFIGKVYENDALDEDNSDLELRRAPELTYTVALNYNTLMATDDYQGAVGNFPGSDIEAYGLLDAFINYRLGNWKLGVHGPQSHRRVCLSHNFGVAMTSDGGGLWTFTTPRKPRHFDAEETYTFGDH